MSWKGYYVQCGQQHQMDLGNIVINAGPGGTISGGGNDTVGPFHFDGSFSPNQPICRFVKQYDGKHAIYYEGTFDQSTRSISGNWGFHAGSKDGDFKIYQ